MRAFAPSTYIRAPWWDGFWVLSFLWLLPLALLLADGHADPYRSPVDSLYFVLSIGFWIGHRVSSTWLAYFTSAYRPLLRTQRVRFVWVPIGILVGTATLIFLPDQALPWSRADRLIGLAILDYGLVTYHFAAQHYGFLSLYRVRAGQRRSTSARVVDRVYALVVGGLFVFGAELLQGAVTYQHLWIDPWLAPETLTAVYAAARTILLVLVGAAVVAMGLLELRSGAPSGPRFLYVVGIAAMVLAALYLHPFLFLVVWTAQHWLAAMGLASLAARAEPEPGASRWYRLWHVVNRRAWAVVLVLAALSIVLTPAMEVEALSEGADRYGDRVFPFAATWWTKPGLVPFLVVLGFVTAFVHYALDRAVWRLSDPEVRSAARGLLRAPTA